MHFSIIPKPTRICFRTVTKNQCFDLMGLLADWIAKCQPKKSDPISWNLYPINPMGPSLKLANIIYHRPKKKVSSSKHPIYRCEDLSFRDVKTNFLTSIDSNMSLIQRISWSFSTLQLKTAELNSCPEQIGSNRIDLECSPKNTSCNPSVRESHEPTPIHVLQCFPSISCTHAAPYSYLSFFGYMCKKNVGWRYTKSFTILKVDHLQFLTIQ